MQARLLLQLMPDSSFNPILMWHLYTYHQYDKLIKCKNGTQSVDYYTFEIMVKNKITENYLVKLLNFQNNTSFIFVQENKYVQEIKSVLCENFDFIPKDYKLM